MKKSNLASSRRQFLFNILPAGTMFCLGCSNLFAVPFSLENQEDSTGIQKSLGDSGLNYKDIYDDAFRSWLIPHMKNLAIEIGQEKLIKLLKESSITIGSQSGKKWAESVPQNDFAAFANSLKRNLIQYHFIKDVLSHEIIKQSENEMEVKFTECLWARTFREENASNIGYAIFCYQDYAVSTSYNPKLKLIRDKTLMEGEDFCHFRWIWEG